MRWMFCAHKPETNLLFGYHRADETRRRFLIPLWNVYSFFVTYANLDGWEPGQKAAETYSELDRWMLARLNQVVGQVTERMDDYDPYGATLALEPLLDDLTNWYVRRSRRRFWKSEHDADKEGAYATLYQVLLTLCKVLAPIVPFVTEVMYQNLARSVDKNVCESVHHCDWPQADEGAVDQDLLDQMALTMQIAALGRSARSTSNVKLRQPLARARVFVGRQAPQLAASLVELITDELNVKGVEFVEQEGDLVEYEIGLLPNILGPKHGRRFPLIRKAVAAADAGALVRRFQAGLSSIVELDDGDPAIELLPEEVEVRSHGREGYAVAEEKGLVVAVDINITPALAREGLARDLVRRVQTMRKEANFELDDRIVTYYQADDEVEAVIEAWADYIQAETLSVELACEAVPNDVAEQDSFELDGHSVVLGVRKA
jgi:isoleucyl-tRNA synthetase